MSRPPHICTCGRTVQHNARCQCKVAAIRARNKRHDATRPSARERGYDTRWDKARAEWLAHNPWCAVCGGKADTVDHITPHKGDPVLFWDAFNWQSLCAHHHNSTKQRRERRT